MKQLAKGNEISELPLGGPWLERDRGRGRARSSRGLSASSSTSTAARAATRARRRSRRWSTTPEGEVRREPRRGDRPGDQQRRRVPGAAARDRARAGARRERGRAGRRLGAVVKQVKGEYRVKDASLRPCTRQVRAGARALRALVDPPRAPRAERRRRPPRQRDARRGGRLARRGDAACFTTPDGRSANPSTRSTPGVDIGHVHLKVADLDRALDFYGGVLGFELMQRLGAEAAFVSAGGYHHHIGLNTWQSKGGSPPPPGTTGLFHAAILYPTRRALADALRRRARGRDPARRRLRPRRQRGALPPRPRPERGRALLGPPAGAVAARPARTRRASRCSPRRSTSRGLLAELDG